MTLACLPRMRDSALCSHLMPISFQPAPGTILQCDFRGYVLPEIVKHRQVVVLWKHKTVAKLVYVVPLSTTPPRVPELAHPLATLPLPRPEQDPDTPIWIKCDVVNTVSTDRLTMPVNRASRRTAASPINIHISAADLTAVRALVVKALRLA